MYRQTRVAVVTGGNRGIGKEVCRQLASLGYIVVLTARSASAATAAVSELYSDERTVVGSILDVTQPETIQRLEDFVLSEFGHIDALVNNAGVSLDSYRTFPEHSGIQEISPSVLIDTINVNVLGALRLIQRFLPYMKECGYGRIVNVSSGMGRFSKMDSRAPCYRISKAALNALTIIVASEVSGYNILVNAVCPGPTLTRMGPPNAVRTPAEAAKGIVWAVTLPDGGPSGGFFRDMKPLSW
jgi:NAD(P)-dependent dehydrogenase (short-subunit alcohol dehydrogenase family)